MEWRLTSSLTKVCYQFWRPTSRRWQILVKHSHQYSDSSNLRLLILWQVLVLRVGDGRIIRWCLYLHHKSSGCYSTLRNSGLLTLSSDCTLRDYKRSSPSKIGFTTEVWLWATIECLRCNSPPPWEMHTYVHGERAVYQPLCEIFCCKYQGVGCFSSCQTSNKAPDPFGIDCHNNHLWWCQW